HFQDLQTQLQEAEDHIAVARNHYIQAVQDYNVIVRSFPSSLAAMVFGYQLKLSFITENENKTSSEKADF
uniref:LemA family protein n=1 Tax=Nitrosomonas sp. TaxID=42353 RepID=UPI0025D19B5C